MLRISPITPWVILLWAFSIEPALALFCHTDAIGFHTVPAIGTSFSELWSMTKNAHSRAKYTLAIVSLS